MSAQRNAGRLGGDSLKGGAMATELRAESGTSPAPELLTQVYEFGEELVVLVRLEDGLLELRVPRQAVSKPRPPQSHIPGFHPEATPC
jgi:hypothetical protein